MAPGFPAPRVVFARAHRTLPPPSQASVDAGITDVSGAPPSVDSSAFTRTSFASLSLRSGNDSPSASTSGASCHNSHGSLPDGTFLADLLPKTLIRRWSLSDFRIGERVGASRLSAVYRAQHKSTGLELALKCYLRNKLDPFSLTQIKREIQIHSRVAHRSIVPFYGSFEDERGNVYLLLQFTRRGDVFNNLSSAGGVFSEETTRAEIIQPVAAAVAYLHTNGIMHRDIKPENLLVGEVGAGCQLTDFGFAVHYRTNRCVTRLGTVDYMAPEIVRCDKARRDALRAVDRSGYGPEIDCWAIGILAFECLAGRAPFESDSTEETYRRILAEEPGHPRTREPRGARFHPAVSGERPQPATGRVTDAVAPVDGGARFGGGDGRQARVVLAAGRAAPARNFPEARLEDGDGGEANEGRKMDEEMMCAERFPEVLAADEAARPGPGSGASSLGEEPSDRLRSKSTGRLGATLQRGWGKLREFVYSGASASSRASGASVGGFDRYVDPETREGKETREAPGNES